MSTPRRELPSQPRLRSLARLEAEIAAQARLRAQWLARAEAEEGVGQDSRWSRGMLALAERRLAQLERSREVLLAGDEGAEESGEGEPA